MRQGAGFADPETALVADGEGEMEMNNLLRRVLIEVERLPEAQRQTVTLVYAEGFTYREAARILDVPIGTIMSRLATARSMLAGLKESPSATPPMEEDERE
nr:sigma factor-like helix-turn-helix DNA-binding protein [Minwuia thermotolerans]